MPKNSHSAPHKLEEDADQILRFKASNGLVANRSKTGWQCCLNVSTAKFLKCLSNIFWSETFLLLQMYSITEHCRDIHSYHIQPNRHRKWQPCLEQKPLHSLIHYNYSTLVLTQAMERVLNRGLKFCITPLKLNVTEILVDIRKFERKLRWREFFADENSNNPNKEWEPTVFPNKKFTAPTKPSSRSLNILLKLIGKVIFELLYFGSFYLPNHCVVGPARKNLVLHHLATIGLDNQLLI